MSTASKLKDWLIILFSMIIIGLSAWWMLRSGGFDLTLPSDSKLAWHLTRSAGIVSYLLLLASTIWGLFLSNQWIKNWSPGPVSMTLHSTVSWLAVLLGLTHGLLLMFDGYYTYTLSDIFVPFTGPYRPEFVGLGTLAFWMLLLVAVSFWVKKWVGFKIWKRLHYISYVAFLMVTLHGMFAGTDGEHLGFRLLVSIGLALTMTLLVARIFKSQGRRELAR